MTPRPAERRATDSPEQELVCLSARVVADAAARSRIEGLVDTPLDWRLAVDLAKRHAVVPLFHRHVLVPHRGRIPEPAATTLDRTQAATCRAALALAGELVRVLDTLRADGVAAMPYKGPALAAAVYGDVTLRQSTDLDLVVSPRAAAAAGASLARLGYRPLGPSTAGPAAFMRSYPARVFVADSGVVIDLHWSVVSRAFALDLDGDWLWRRARTVPIGGTPVPVPSTEDLLLVLCVHGAKHLWERLAWITDVAELIRTAPTLDYDAVAAEAGKRGTARMLRLGIALAHDVLSAHPPDAARHWALEDSTVAALVATVRARFTLAGRLIPAGDWLPFHLRCRERWTDRLRYLARFVATPTQRDWDAVSLPGRLAGLYTVLRPFRLAAACGRIVGRRLRGARPSLTR